MHPLLQAILANPDDLTTRLVLADWLDEHDDAARAELTRRPGPRPDPVREGG